MNEFINVHADCIDGVLGGFDRLIFRGTLRAISYPDGLFKYLNMNHIRLCQFDEFAQSCTRRVVEHIEQLAGKERRPCLYLSSPKTSKEEVAMDIARRDKISRGLVCVLSCVEPCVSADIYRNRQSRKLEPVFRVRKCKFYYLYLIDDDFGWMHVRIQSWIPFDLQVYINGRSYLECQLKSRNIGCQKQDNCFTQLQDLPRAQSLIDGLEKLNWPRTLDKLVRRFLPADGDPIRLPIGANNYYWTLRQSEYATDVMFKSRQKLAEIYPRLCRHAIERLSGEDVLKFMGKCPSRYGGQVVSNCQKLIQGMRIKHRMGDNSIKMYDKQGLVLRIETTINDPADLRVYRPPLDNPAGKPAWRAMAKSVADIQRRALVCRQANDRYLGAMAAVPDCRPAASVLDPLSKAVTHQGHRYRGLRPICPDEAALFAAVLRGEHLINGLSNATVQRALFGDGHAPRDAMEKRRRSGQVSRKLRLLRRHGLIHKLGRRRLYRVSDKGQQVMTLALTMRQSNSEQLNAA